MIKKETRVRILKNKIIDPSVLKAIGVWKDNEEIYGITGHDCGSDKNEICRIIFDNNRRISYFVWKFEPIDKESAEIKPRGHTLTKMFQFENSKKIKSPNP